MTQFYDQFLAPIGLRATQYSIVSRLGRKGPVTINELAADLIMDRTTLGRNILPLQRDGLISIATGTTDRRRKELQLTQEGAKRLESARARWAEAQTQFEESFGSEHALEMRALLKVVVASDLATR